MTKIAVIGASNNSEKFGYKIVENLKSKGYEVFPVNPKGGEILGLKVYKNISEIDQNIEIVNFVTQSEITLKILQENIEFLQNKKIWCQPGSNNQKVDYFIKNNFKNFIINSCIMIEKI